MSEEAPVGEKERVYLELDRTRKALARRRREVKSLKRATSAPENAVLRREGQSYRKALSNILYRLDNGELDDATLRSIVESALQLRGMKGRHREEILALTQALSEPRPVPRREA